MAKSQPQPVKVDIQELVAKCQPMLAYLKNK